jgi:hypothetical protein
MSFKNKGSNCPHFNYIILYYTMTFILWVTREGVGGVREWVEREVIGGFSIDSLFYDGLRGLFLHGIKIIRVTFRRWRDCRLY